MGEKRARKRVSIDRAAEQSSTRRIAQRTTARAQAISGHMVPRLPVLEHQAILSRQGESRGGGGAQVEVAVVDFGIDGAAALTANSLEDGGRGSRIALQHVGVIQIDVHPELASERVRRGHY